MQYTGIYAYTIYQKYANSTYITPIFYPLHVEMNTIRIHGPDRDSWWCFGSLDHDSDSWWWIGSMLRLWIHAWHLVSGDDAILWKKFKFLIENFKFDYDHDSWSWIMIHDHELWSWFRFIILIRIHDDALHLWPWFKFMIWIHD